MRFSRQRFGSAITATVEPAEADVLRDLLEQVVALLADDEDVVVDPDDPFAGLAALGKERDPPVDPALARLLPDAYATDDEEGRAAAADYRRFTERGLRETKTAAARTALATLPEEGGKLHLHTQEAQAWLAALNDVRLALGVRLEVTAESEEPDDDDPRAPAYAVYGWLGWLQETLVDALMKGR